MAILLVGPLTTLIEAAAAAVAAGTVLGSFALGLRGLVLRWPRPRLEARTMESGYFGGLVGLVAILADITIRYIG